MDQNEKDTRCLCITTDKWWNDKERRVTDEVDMYIRDFIKHANEVRNTPDILEDRSLVGLSKLAKGIDPSLRLLEMDIVKYESIFIRAQIQEEVPFKLHECRYNGRCCGTCVKRCHYRCALDVLYRMSDYMYPYYMGFEEPETFEQTVTYQLFMNPNTNYISVVDCLNDIMKGRDKLSENYKDYKQQKVTTVDKKGKIKPVINPETGEHRVIEWPASGMCPYCYPRVLASKLREHYGSSSNRGVSW